MSFYDLPVGLSEAAFYAAMDTSREQLEALVHSVSPDGLHAPRDAAGWSTLDHLAHVGAWQQGVADLLDGKPRHAGMGISQELYATGDFDRINAVIRDWTSRLSTAEQLALFANAHRNLLAAVERVGWDGLQLPAAHYDVTRPADPDGAPVLETVWADGPAHFEEHAGWIRELHGLPADS